MCPICLENWDGTGPHRVCCLKCGDIFGRNCIETWLKTKRSCPKCNTHVANNRDEIRYYFKN